MPIPQTTLQTHPAAPAPLLTVTGTPGNDRLSGGNGNDSLAGLAGNDTLVGSDGNDTLSGGDGVDTVDYGSVGLFLRVDLTQGQAVQTYTEEGDRYVYTLSSIENFVCGDGDGITLIGSAGNNLLASGRTFESLLVGNAGADTLISGDGSDLLYGFSNNESGVSGSGDAADRLEGGGGDDTMYGNAGNDILLGGAGNDSLRGDAGNDTLDGGSGNSDVAVYRLDELVVTSGRTLSLAASGTASTVTVTDERGGTDTLIGIERVQITGTAYADTLSGGNGDDVLTGGNGNDSLRGGAGKDDLRGGSGDDTLDGGAGNDDALNYDFAGASAGISFSATGLDSTTAVRVVDEGGDTDTLIGIERLVVTGSRFADTLAGSSGDDVIDGGEGPDRLKGGAGRDALSGGVGDDTLDGGNGNGRDTLSGYDGFYGLDTVTYANADAAVNVNLATGVVAGEGGDVLFAISNVIGSAFADTLVGSWSDNRLDGGAGADTMTGGTGNDIYVINQAADVVVEVAYEGIDRVISSLSHTLLAEFEQLTLSGSSHLSGTGNGLDNELAGNAGNNLLRGGAGNDELRGGAGSDTLDGGAGSRDAAAYAWDEVATSSGVVFSAAAIGTAGTVSQRDERGATDILIGIERAHLTGSAFADSLTGSSGNDHFIGGAGNDTMTGGSGAADTVEYDFGRGGATAGVGFLASELGTSSTIRVVDEFGHTDTLSAIEQVLVTGSSSGDRLYAGSGNDTVSGGDGNDSLRGGTGRDLLDGGYGNDTVNGGNAAGGDQLIGGDGTDTLSYSGADAGVVVDLNESVGGENADSIDEFEILIGSAHADRLSSESWGTRFIEGGGGNDVLRISGQDMGAQLDGGTGNDTLSGGESYDSYRFSTALDGNRNVDFLSRFDPYDRVQLENTVFAKLTTTGALSANHFRASSSGTAADSNDHVLYETDTGKLFYDADGSGPGLAVLFATLVAAVPLDADDSWVPHPPTLTAANIFVT